MLGRRTRTLVPKSAMGFSVSLGLYQSLRVDGIVHDLDDALANSTPFRRLPQGQRMWSSRRSPSIRRCSSSDNLELRSRLPVTEGMPEDNPASRWLRVGAHRLRDPRPLGSSPGTFMHDPASAQPVSMGAFIHCPLIQPSNTSIAHPIALSTRPIQEAYCRRAKF